MDRDKDYKEVDKDHEEKENSLVHIADEYGELIIKAIKNFAADPEEDDIEKLKQ